MRGDSDGSRHDECEGIPAFAGMTKWGAGMTIAAGAAMTKGVGGNDDLVSGWRSARELRVAVTPSWQSGG